MRVLSTKPVATPATKDKVAILAHVESDTIARTGRAVGCADAVVVDFSWDEQQFSAHASKQRSLLLIDIISNSITF